MDLPESAPPPANDDALDALGHKFGETVDHLRGIVDNKNFPGKETLGFEIAKHLVQDIQACVMLQGNVLDRKIAEIIRGLAALPAQCKKIGNTSPPNVKERIEQEAAFVDKQVEDLITPKSSKNTLSVLSRAAYAAMGLLTIVSLSCSRMNMGGEGVPKAGRLEKEPSPKAMPQDKSASNIGLTKEERAKYDPIFRTIHAEDLKGFSPSDSDRYLKVLKDLTPEEGYLAQDVVSLYKARIAPETVQMLTTNGMGYRSAVNFLLRTAKMAEVVGASRGSFVDIVRMAATRLAQFGPVFSREHPGYGGTVAEYLLELGVAPDVANRAYQVLSRCFKADPAKGVSNNNMQLIVELAHAGPNLNGVDLDAYLGKVKEYLMLPRQKNFPMTAQAITNYIISDISPKKVEEQLKGYYSSGYDFQDNTLQSTVINRLIERGLDYKRMAGLLESNEAFDSIALCQEVIKGIDKGHLKRTMQACHLNAQNLFRYDKQVLKQLYKNLNDHTFNKPVAVIVMPEEDHNGAFAAIAVAQFKSLQSRGFRVLLCEAGGQGEMLDAMRDMGIKKGTVQHMAICGHGFPTGTALRENPSILDMFYSKPAVTTGDTSFMRKLNSYLVPKTPDGRREATVDLVSCSTGRGGFVALGSKDPENLLTSFVRNTNAVVSAPDRDIMPIVAVPTSRAKGWKVFVSNIPTHTIPPRPMPDK